MFERVFLGVVCGASCLISLPVALLCFVVIMAWAVGMGLWVLLCWALGGGQYE